MPNRGAANTDNGILIAMTKLDKLYLHEDYVSVGAGLRWGPVFDFLAPEGLTVVGGRVGIVGVPGLILGGGLSTFSGNRGFACDNVKQFQVVIAGGKVVEASQDSNSDLFWALKGGSNNFGIVTRFDLYTYFDSNIYTGLQSLDMKHWDEVAVAINNFITLRSDDSIADKMAIAPKLQWVVNQTPEILLHLTSTLLPAPNDGWSDRKGSGLVVPPGLVDFADLPFNKNASTDMYTTTLSESLKTISIPSGLRYELRVVSFRSSAQILIALRKVFEEEFAPVFANVQGFSGVMEIQPITKRNIRQGYARGGNTLGITEDRAPMIC
ncbi:FAD binding domain-containing protein [Colletotrichum tofieldiae]|nr:FAD binding domain-containing protein [Colletotrichum tofieldiae]GKT76713.1 FAD binding domain-containing protein [Colletotrichum tofieldiae]